MGRAGTSEQEGPQFKSRSQEAFLCGHLSSSCVGVGVH